MAREAWVFGQSSSASLSRNRGSSLDGSRIFVPLQDADTIQHESRGQVIFAKRGWPGALAEARKTGSP